MLMQYEALKWRLPEIITYVPIPFYEKMKSAYSLTELLAKELGALSDCIVLSPQRIMGLQDKRILVIGGNIKSRETCEKIGEAFSKAAPSQLMLMAVMLQYFDVSSESACEASHLFQEA